MGHNHNITIKNNKIKTKTNKTKKTFKKKDFYSGDGFLTSTWGATMFTQSAL